MSKFYGQVEGMAQTVASRRGSSFIKSSAQSYDGSVIVKMNYDLEGKLMISLNLTDGSDFYGQCFFYGTMEELKKKLQG